MVRTKADNGGRKAVAAKAPRKVLGATAATAGGAGPSSPTNSKYGGGNPVCARPTPEWQKGIGSFLVASTSHDKENSLPSEVTVDVHVHSQPEETAASVSSSAEDSSVAETPGGAAVEPSLTVEEQGSSESGHRNGLIDSDSDED